jgi:hypothetical protein
VNITSVDVTLTTSGTTLNPGVLVAATNSNININGTLYLEKLSGSKWVSVTSWSVSGTGVLNTSKNFTGTSGTTYRSRFAGTAGTDKVDQASASRSI